MVHHRNALLRELRRASYRGERAARSRAQAAVDAAERRAWAALEEAIYDEGPEARVRRLRASVLGEPEPAPSLSGLAAWLPTHP